MLKCMFERSSFIDHAPKQATFQTTVRPRRSQVWTCAHTCRSNANLGSRHDMQRKFGLAITSRPALFQ